MDIFTLEKIESIDRTDSESKDQSLNKKSILHERKSRGTALSIGLIKRGSSKLQIQWKGVKEKGVDEERKIVKTSLPALGLLASRGYRWHFLHDVMNKQKWDESRLIKHSDEDVPSLHQRELNSLIRDFGTEFLQKRFDKSDELTLDQQTQLEILKHKNKTENDSYLNRHPELDVMLQLVYAALFRNQPENPKLFVAEYVHHLNMFREELVVQEVDIPFDRPPVVEEITSEEEERQNILMFAQKLVERCVSLASHGAAYVDVMSIINSMLQIVSPSEEDVSIPEAIKSAEEAVSEILMSLLTSVAIQKTPSSEFVVDEILSSILATALPFVQRDSEVYIEMRESVEQFVRGLVGSICDEVSGHIYLRELFKGEDEEENSKESVRPTRPILRKDLSPDVKDEVEAFRAAINKPETRVKFQSINPDT